MDTWLKEREKNVYSPYNGNVLIGFGFIGIPTGRVVGEYWFDEKGKVNIEFFHDYSGNHIKEDWCNG